MKNYYSISELLSMNLDGLPASKMGLGSKVVRENWPFIEVAGKGGKNGKRREYAPPTDVMKLIRMRESAAVLSKVEADVPALASGSDLIALPGASLVGTTEKQRQCEAARMGVLNAVERLMTETGAGKDAAIATLLTQARMPEFSQLAKMMEMATDGRGGGQSLPSVRTIKRWFAARSQHDLVPKGRLKDIQPPAWLAAFLECYRLPMKPSVSEAYRLFLNRLAPGDEVPSVHQVRRWLNKVGNVERERGRRGARDLKTLLPHARREFMHLPPAAIITGDGHTFDAEVLNPLSGLPFRPEITTVIDVGTRRCLGWSVGLAESRFTVLEALSHASRTAIGGIWYVDWGKGFENLMMTDEATGLMGRLGMTMKHSRAYNSQAKGASERSHNIFTRAAANLPTFVGKKMDDEARQKVFKLTRREIKLHGKVINSPIPTWDDFKRYIEQSVNDYNDRPHRSLPKFTDQDGKRRHMSPNEFWALKVAEFGEPPKVAEEDEGWLFRPQVMRTVRRGEVSLFNNVYFSLELTEFNGETVRVGYDVQDAGWVWIYDDAGRLICKAEWHGNSQAYQPESVVAQALDKRNAAQLKRNELKRQNILAEKRVQVIEHQDTVNIGGLVLDMNQVKERAARIAARHDDVVIEEMEVKEVKKTAEPPKAQGWTVPEKPQERFVLYQRLNGRPDLPEQVQRWLIRYPQSNEFKALSKRAAQV